MNGGGEMCIEHGTRTSVPPPPKKKKNWVKMPLLISVMKELKWQLDQSNQACHTMVALIQLGGVAECKHIRTGEHLLEIRYAPMQADGLEVRRAPMHAD